jgi:hypothetical protein
MTALPKFDQHTHTFDGQPLTFIHGNNPAAVIRNPPIFYVNGIKNTAVDHRDTAVELSRLTGRPVTGIYNKSDSLVVDLIESAINKFTFDVNFDRLGFIKSAHFLDKTGAWPEDLTIRCLAAQNLASLGLFIALKGRATSQLVCHSQGCLATRNAVVALAHVFGRGIYGQIEVHVMGSPAEWWPEEMRGHMKHYAFCGDFVAAPFGGVTAAGRCDNHREVFVHNVKKFYFPYYEAQIRQRLGVRPN